MPRKSAASAAAITDAGADTSMISNTETAAPKSSTKKTTSNKKEQEIDGFTIDDLLLPRSLVSRIARGVLPPNTSIQKDAILALCKSATVFISHLASEANDLTDRKTVQSGDVINAIRLIEMDQVMGIGEVGSDGRLGGRLEREVAIYEESIKGKRKGYREKVKARESGVSQATNGDGEVEDREHERKRIRRDPESEDAEMADVSRLDDTDAAIDLNKGQEAISGSAEHITNVPVPDGHPRGDDEVNDQTDTDPEMVEDEEDDDQDDEEEDDEEEEDVEGEMQRGEADDEDNDLSRRKSNGVLVPNGRIEMDDGSDDESD